LSLTQGEELWLRLFKSRVLRNILELKWVEVTGSGEEYITRVLMVWTPKNCVLFG
jgi:hypothetical protein